MFEFVEFKTSLYSLMANSTGKLYGMVKTHKYNYPLRPVFFNAKNVKKEHTLKFELRL